MEKLGDILRYTKPSHQLTAALICARAQEIVGDKGRVVSCDKGALKIAVKDNYQAAAIAQNNIDLIERINQRLGREIVKRLRFTIQAD